MRKPEKIRQSCARKLERVKTSGKFTAILGCLLCESWTNPKIEELIITSDGFLLAREQGDCGFNELIGTESDLDRNIRGIAGVAELDDDELKYLLNRAAGLKCRRTA